MRELAELMITKASVGPMDNNAYLLRCRQTGESLLIDAAAEPDDAARHARQRAPRHHHHHPPAPRPLVRPRRRGQGDGRDHRGRRGRRRRHTGRHVAPVGDGDRVEFGRISLEVIHLVGHTPGSIALLYDDPAGPPHLWTGDSLFPGGVGNTHGNPEDFASLLHDVETKIFDRLPDETWVYPGHGNDTTLGNERPHVPEWRARGW